MSPAPPRSLISRRHFTAGAVLAAPAVIARPARAARTITFAGHGGWFRTVFDPAILDPFRKAHPDIAVTYASAGNSFQRLGLLRAQRESVSTDVVLLEAGMSARAAAEGLLEPLDAASAPALKQPAPGAIPARLGGPALMFDSLALGFNPAQVGRAPHSWRDLWDTGFGHGVVLQTPPDPLGLAMTAVAASLFGGGDSQRGLDIAMNALRELAPRVVQWDPIPDVYGAITTGNAGIGPCWNAEAQNRSAQSAGRFAAAVPDDGSPFITTTVNLVKGSPRSEDARVLIAWLLAPEAQRLLTETMFYAPANPLAAGAKGDIAASLLARAGASPAMAAHRMAMDWTTVSAMRDRITEAWRTLDLANRR